MHKALFKTGLFALACGCLVLSLSACETKAGFDKEVLPDDYTRREDLNVAIEICMPEEHVSFEAIEMDLTNYPKSNADPPPAGVRRVIPIPGVYFKQVTMYVYTGDVHLFGHPNQWSSGSSAAPLQDATVTGQPVFLANEGPLSELVAHYVAERTDDKDKHVVYYFVPPKASSIPIGRYSKWATPTLSKDLRVPSRDWLWPTGTPLTAITAAMPRARYMLSTRRSTLDYVWGPERQWVFDHFPGIRYIGDFLHNSQESIPSCD